MINPASLFKIKGAWERFASNHPKFPAFMQAASSGMISEGAIIDVTITAADGRKIGTNVKLTQSDMELFEQLKNMK